MKLKNIIKAKEISMSTLLKTCSFLLKTIPPLKNAHPSTSNILDKIEPNKESWTTRVIPLFSAYIDMINSVAFPNVAFKRPPTARYNIIKFEINHHKHMTDNKNRKSEQCKVEVSGLIFSNDI